eukprot:10066148-Lingulodinium_polyedra.AAC.1
MHPHAGGAARGPPRALRDGAVSAAGWWQRPDADRRLQALGCAHWRLAKRVLAVPQPGGRAAALRLLPGWGREGRVHHQGGAQERRPPT